MTPRTDFCHYCPAGPMTPRGCATHEAIRHGVYEGGVKIPSTHDPLNIQFPLRLAPDLYEALLQKSIELDTSRAEVARMALREFCQPLTVSPNPSTLSTP